MFKFTKIAILLFFLLIQLCFFTSQALAASGCLTSGSCNQTYLGTVIPCCSGYHCDSTNNCVPGTGAVTTQSSNLNFTPEITVGNFVAGTNITVSNNTQTIAEYIKQIYQYAIGVVAIIAVVVMMIGGVLWMTAGGNTTQVSTAKSYISGSLLGLLLILFSFVILKTVNPDLVNFKVTSIQTPTTSSSDSSSNNNGAGCCCQVSADKQSFSSCTFGQQTSCDTTSDTTFFQAGKDCTQVEGCPQYIAGCCYKNTGMGGNGNYIYSCTDVATKANCDTTDSYTFYAEGKQCNQVEKCPQYQTGVTGSW